MTPIQTLIIDRLAELDISYREASARTNGLLSHGHLNQIALGRTSRALQRSTIDGLALALDLPRTVVAEAAEQSVKVPDKQVEFRLPEKANHLTMKQRKAVLAYVNALLEKD